MKRNVTLIGLLFGMVGVGVIFFFGYPQPSFEPSQVIGAEAAADTGILEQKEKYTFRSKCGLALIGLGFAFEFVAQFFGEAKAQPKATGTEKERTADH